MTLPETVNVSPSSYDDLFVDTLTTSAYAGTKITRTAENKIKNFRLIKDYSIPVKISTTLAASFSISTEGSAEINNKIWLTGNGKLIKTALSLLAAR